MGDLLQLDPHRLGGNSQRLQDASRHAAVGAQQAQQHIPGADSRVTIGQCLLLGQDQNLLGRFGVSRQSKQGHHQTSPLMAQACPDRVRSISCTVKQSRDSFHDPEYARNDLCRQGDERSNLSRQIAKFASSQRRPPEP